MASKHTQEPEDNAGSGKDAEADGDATDANTDGILTIDVEGLGGPEEQDREEVGTGDEGDDECEDQNSRVLLQAAWEHGELGELPFPDEERSDECGADEKWCEDMC